MGWRVGQPRPINKQAGARPIIDEQNSVVALVLLGSSRNESNVDAIVRAPLVLRACLEAVELLGESHRVSHILRQAIGLNSRGEMADASSTWGETSSSSSTTTPTTA